MACFVHIALLTSVSGVFSAFGGRGSLRYYKTAFFAVAKKAE
jgi:hypothetical protein